MLARWHTWCLCAACLCRDGAPVARRRPCHSVTSACAVDGRQCCDGSLHQQVAGPLVAGARGGWPPADTAHKHQCTGATEACFGPESCYTRCVCAPGATSTGHASLSSGCGLIRRPSRTSVWLGLDPLMLGSGHQMGLSLVLLMHCLSGSAPCRSCLCLWIRVCL